jgi:hypothetical protein
MARAIASVRPSSALLITVKPAVRTSIQFASGYGTLVHPISEIIEDTGKISRVNRQAMSRCYFSLAQMHRTPRTRI